MEVEKIEERLRALEIRVATVFAGGVVLLTCILGFFAYEKWLDIPSKVQAEFSAIVGMEKIKVIEDMYKKAKDIGPIISLLPIGSIIPWHKSLSEEVKLTAQWKECDGSVVNDQDSPYNGKILPKLNQEYLFLRGREVSGIYQEQDSTTIFIKGEKKAESKGGPFPYKHEDTLSRSKSAQVFSGKWEEPATELTFTFIDKEVRPANMSVVWIIKIK
jgi:hypothetical protein